MSKPFNHKTGPKRVNEGDHLGLVQDVACVQGAGAGDDVLLKSLGGGQSEKQLAANADLLPNRSTSALSTSYAGFWLRAVAAVLDAALALAGTTLVALPLGVLIAVVMAPLHPSEEIINAETAMVLLVILLVHWLSHAVAEASVWQASVGKKLLGLRVSDLAGDRISLARANVRYGVKLLTGLLLGLGWVFVVVALTRNKQGLHDILTRTLVKKI